MPLYIDVFRVKDDGGMEPVLAVDTASRDFSLEIPETGNYLLRLASTAKGYLVESPDGPLVDPSLRVRPVCRLAPVLKALDLPLMFFSGFQ